MLPVAAPFGRAATCSEVLVASKAHQAVQAAPLDKSVSVATLSHQPPTMEALVVLYR